MDSGPPRDLPNEIGNLGSNEAIIRMLVAQLQTPLGVTPFVGAGLTNPFGFPSWRGFLLEKAKEAHIEEKLQQRLDAGEYEEAAEDLLNGLGRQAFHDAIDIAFGDDKIEDKRLGGAVSLLPDLTTGPVITTNYDHVLEKVFEQARKPFERVIWGAKAESAIRAYHQSRRYLLKIHGDVEDRADRILTREDYDKYYGRRRWFKIDLSSPLPLLLQLMFAVRPLLFIGCSLNQDRWVAILDEVGRKYPIPHFAIVACPASTEQFRERSRFLSNHNIRPVWYPPGRHDKRHVLIEPLLEYLVDQTKDHEHMISRTDRRKRSWASFSKPDSLPDDEHHSPSGRPSNLPD